MKLVRPKLRGFYTKQDYHHAVQVWALCRELLRRGATFDELKDLLSDYHGGFGHWRFLFEDTKP